MNPILHDIYATGVTTTPDGDQIAVGEHGISLEVAEMLSQIVRDSNSCATLEVGLAYGLSALAICDALPKTSASRHTVIDPHQNSQPRWGGIGLHNLRRAGFEKLIEFYESPSYRVLPQLEASGRKVDFAFIDGWHTFDFAFVDFFYIDKLLRIGGIVTFDDADMPSIHRVIRYIVTNLPYSVFKTLPENTERRSLKGRVYRSFLSTAAFTLDAFSRIPGFGNRVPGLVAAELFRMDKKFGLVGRCIALCKDDEDKRQWFYHREF